MNTNAIRGRNGTGLIVVMLIMAFIAAVGTALVSLTGMGTKMAGSLRTYDDALGAAEAGFEASRSVIEGSFVSGAWTTFDRHYVDQPTGIDLPLQSGNPNPSYFRCRTDEQLLSDFDSNGDGTPNVSNLLFFQQPYIVSQYGGMVTKYVYTAFLIDDDAAANPSNRDHSSALLVVIGSVRDGTRVLKSSRLEVNLAVAAGGKGKS
jgi:hypothetical protein